MNQWAFVWAAYAVTLGGAAALAAAAWLQMRGAEQPVSSKVER